MSAKIQEQKSQPREIKITIRLNPEELKMLDQKRGIVPRATFFRKNLIHAKIPPQVPEVNRKAYLETARWAANLNQISHFFHMHGDEIQARGTEEIYSYLKKFRAKLIGLDFSGDDEKHEA
jgi:hypothetical protein